MPLNDTLSRLSRPLMMATVILCLSLPAWSYMCPVGFNRVTDQTPSKVSKSNSRDYYMLFTNEFTIDPHSDYIVAFKKGAVGKSYFLTWDDPAGADEHQLRKTEDPYHEMESLKVLRKIYQDGTCTEKQAENSRKLAEQDNTITPCSSSYSTSKLRRIVWQRTIMNGVRIKTTDGFELRKGNPDDALADVNHHGGRELAKIQKDLENEIIFCIKDRHAEFNELDDEYGENIPIEDTPSEEVVKETVSEAPATEDSKDSTEDAGIEDVEGLSENNKSKE